MYLGLCEKSLHVYFYPSFVILTCSLVANESY